MPKLGNGKIRVYVGFGTAPDSSLTTFEIISAIEDLKKGDPDLDIDVYLFDSQANEAAPVTGTQDLFFTTDAGETPEEQGSRVAKIFGKGQGGGLGVDDDHRRFVFALDNSGNAPAPVKLTPNTVYDPPVWGVRDEEDRYVSMDGAIAKKVEDGSWIWIKPTDN